MEGIIYRRLYDEDGAIISLDGKTLFKVPNVSRYRVPEGIEEIDINAFKNRPNLREIDIPYTVEWYTDYPMSNNAMRYAPKGLKVNYWNWPYPENCIRSYELEEEIANGFVDEFGAVYSKDGKRLLKCADVKNYKIREGTETVERLAFIGCDKLQCLYIPYTCPEESFDAILGGTDTGVACHAVVFDALSVVLRPSTGFVLEIFPETVTILMRYFRPFALPDIGVILFKMFQARPPITPIAWATTTLTHHCLVIIIKQGVLAELAFETEHAVLQFHDALCSDGLRECKRLSVLVFV